MLLLGNEVTIKIYKKNESFEQMRGKVHQFEETKLIVTEHPDILLKNPLQKRGVWHDLSMSSSILSEDQR
jgi:uracil-DNA glycosylase